MSIASKNPTKKKYQSSQRVHTEAKKINIDFNYKTRPTSGYITHFQNSRQMNAINTNNQKDQSDIKHIIELYDKKVSQVPKNPPNLLK